MPKVKRVGMLMIVLYWETNWQWKKHSKRLRNLYDYTQWVNQRFHWIQDQKARWQGVLSQPDLIWKTMKKFEPGMESSKEYDTPVAAGTHAVPCWTKEEIMGDESIFRLRLCRRHTNQKEHKKIHNIPMQSTNCMRLKGQKSVMLSSIEVEYMAISEVAT